MKNLQDFPYRRMRNFDAAQTFSNLATIYGRITEEKLTPSVSAFTQAAKTLADCIRQQIASASTREIQILQRQRDRTITELFHGAANGMYNYDQTVVEAANRVNIILRLYGNPAREPMDTQTRAIEKIVRDLTAPDMKNFLAKLPICKTAVEQLTLTNKTFAQLFLDRTIETKGREVGLTARYRIEADDAARTAADLINSFINLFNEHSIDAIVDEANAVLDEARALINRRAAHRNKTEDNALKPIDIPPLVVSEGDGREGGREGNEKLKMGNGFMPDTSAIPDHIPDNNPDPDHHAHIPEE